jgi:hypothetical protein
MATTEQMEYVFTCNTWHGQIELRAGDEVGVVPGGYGERPPTVHRVVKVTHKGQRVRLDNGREFNGRGRPVGDVRGFGSSPRLISAEQARQQTDPRRTRAALIHHLDKLCDLLAAEIRRVNEQSDFAPLSAEQKAALVAMIEAM